MRIKNPYSWHHLKRSFFTGEQSEKWMMQWAELEFPEQEGQVHTSHGLDVGLEVKSCSSFLTKKDFMQEDCLCLNRGVDHWRPRGEGES